MQAVLVTVAELKAATLPSGAAAVQADDVYERVASAAEGALVAVLEGTAADLVDVAEVREVALLLAVDLWSRRTSGGGGGMGPDLTPYGLGMMAVRRYYGLLASHLDPAVFVA